MKDEVNLRIALQIADLHNIHLTGQQKIGFNLANKLAGHGIGTLVITNNRFFSAPAIFFNEDIEYVVIPGVADIHNYLWHLGFIVRALKKFNPTLIHGHGFASGNLVFFLGELISRPTIHTVYDVPFDLRPIPYVQATGMRRAKWVICTSIFVKRQLEVLGVKSDKLKVLPYGVEDVWFDIHMQNRVPESVLFYGDANQARGIDTLLEAIPMVLGKRPSAKFFLAIRACEPAYEEMILEFAEKGLLSLISLRKGQHISELTSMAQVIVLPYVMTTLQPPLTLIESLLSGKAVVTTDVEAK